MLGECRVPVNRRTPVGQPSTHRYELAERSGKTRWTMNPPDRLIKDLLRVEADTRSAGEFLRRRTPLVHLDSAGYLWPAQLIHRLSAAWPIIVDVAIAVLVLWWVINGQVNELQLADQSSYRTPLPPAISVGDGMHRSF